MADEEYEYENVKLIKLYIGRDKATAELYGAGDKMLTVAKVDMLDIRGKIRIDYELSEQRQKIFFVEPATCKLSGTSPYQEEPGILKCK